MLVLLVVVVRTDRGIQNSRFKIQDRWRRKKYHPRLIGVGVGIGIGVEKLAGQRPIPTPTATPTPRDRVVLTFLRNHNA
ncbi:MAG: hypothetical protein R6U13_13635 [Desulfatiglandaceae bacterium]